MKYNIKEKSVKKPNYINTISVNLIERVYDEIIRTVVVEKGYRDCKLTAGKIATQLNVPGRYISAVCQLRYRDSFPQLINDARIREAQFMLSNHHFADMTMSEIAAAVGYSNRQNFYVAFYQRTKMTPVDFRKKYSDDTTAEA